MFVTNRKIVISLTVVAIALSLMPSALCQNQTENSPIGTYLWFPDPLGPKSDVECRDLVARLKPSAKQAEQWLWGQIPDIDPPYGPYYLIISKSRMEPTFSAEGDYDFGDLSLGQTKKGETPFTLAPDDHPEIKMTGTILAKSDSQIVTVTLNAVPLDDGVKDRTVYYCRFDDLTGVET